MKEGTQIARGAKAIMFEVSSGEKVFDYLNKCLKEKKKVGLSYNDIAQKMTLMIQPKFPNDYISGQVVQYWLKQMKSKGR